MSHILCKKGKELALGAGLNLSAGTVMAALVRLDGTLTDTYLVQVTGATNATPVVLTASNTWTVGDIVLVKGVGGTTSANGLRRILARSSTTITLGSLDGVNTAGNGAYTSGGCIVNVSKCQYWGDLSAAVIGTPVALGSKTLTEGVFNSAAIAWTSVPAGAVTGWVCYVDVGGNEATSPLVFISDGRTNVTVAADAAQNATTLWVERLEGHIPSGSTIVLSNGVTATLSSAASAGARSLAVGALSAATAAGSNGDAAWTNAAFPITLGTTGNVTTTPDAGSGFVGAIAGLFEI